MRPFSITVHRILTLQLALLSACATPTAPSTPPSSDAAASTGGPDLASAVGDALLAGDLDAARAALRDATASADGQTQWFGWSGLVALARADGDTEGALRLTAELRARWPERSALATLWDGDTLAAAGDVDGAIAQWTAASDEDGALVPVDEPLAVVALEQQAALLASVGRHAEAAEAAEAAARIATTPARVEANLVAAALSSAIDAGDLPDAHPEDLAGSCGPDRPCEIGVGPDLVDLGGLRVHVERRAPLPVAAAPPPPVCVATTATDGFVLPMVNDHYGDRWLTNPAAAGGVHPGVDYNGPGAGNADCGLRVNAVARGCVTSVSPTAGGVPTSWGSATIQHYYTPYTAGTGWTSQYGHTRALYVSVGMSLARGARVADVGNVGTGTCHLHWEVREPDHVAPTNAAYWNNGSTMTSVADGYEDPDTFVGAHRSYRNVLLADDGGAFFTLNGAWTPRTDLGQQDDMRYATTVAGARTAWATWTFTASATGSWELWASVPWNYATTTNAPWTLKNNTTGATVASGRYNQLALSDQWLRLTTTNLTANTAYRLEVGNDTGSAGQRVGVDTFMAIRP